MVGTSGQLFSTTVELLIVTRESGLFATLSDLELLVLPSSDLSPIAKSELLPQVQLTYQPRKGFTASLWVSWYFAGMVRTKIEKPHQNSLFSDKLTAMITTYIAFQLVDRRPTTLFDRPLFRLIFNAVTIY